MTRPRPISLDDEVVSLARRYRKEALASLVTVLRDEHAPASARAAASAKLLEYSDGKPSQARQLTVADVSAMTPSLRQELLHALLVHYQTEMPAQFKAMLKASVDEALRLQAALPKPPLTDPAKVTKFKRGPLAGKGPEVPRWPPHPPTLTPRSDAIRRDSCGEPSGVACTTTSRPRERAVRASNRLA